MNRNRSLTWIPTAILALASIVAPQSAFGQATARASASIVHAITIAKSQDLVFGLVVSDAVGGTVSISTDGIRTSTGPVLFVQSVPGSTYQAAQFIVSGEANYIYTITLPNSSQTLTGNSGSARQMSVDGFNSDPSATGVLTLGTSILRIGATLHVDAGKVAGVYAGSFDITVAYQ